MILHTSSMCANRFSLDRGCPKCAIEPRQLRATSVCARGVKAIRAIKAATIPQPARFQSGTVWQAHREYTGTQIPVPQVDPRGVLVLNEFGDVGGKLDR